MLKLLKEELDADEHVRLREYATLQFELVEGSACKVSRRSLKAATGSGLTKAKKDVTFSEAMVEVVPTWPEFTEAESDADSDGDPSVLESSSAQDETCPSPQLQADEKAAKAGEADDPSAQLQEADEVVKGGDSSASAKAAKKRKKKKKRNKRQ